MPIRPELPACRPEAIPGPLDSTLSYCPDRTVRRIHRCLVFPLDGFQADDCHRRRRAAVRCARLTAGFLPFLSFLAYLYSPHGPEPFRHRRGLCSVRPHGGYSVNALIIKPDTYLSFVSFPGMFARLHKALCGQNEPSCRRAESAVRLLERAVQGSDVSLLPRNRTAGGVILALTLPS